MTKSVGLGLSPVASWLFISFQVVLIVLYGLFTRHVGTVTVDHSKSSSSDVDASTAGHSKGEEIFNVGPYAAFQDVHVMIFIGFGFLMTFLSRYSYSAVGFNFLLAALAVEWSILCQGFLHAWHSQHAYITLKLSNLLAADIASAAFLISFGVILGRLTPLQLMVMVVIQMPLFAINEHLTYFVFKATDVGGSIVVHLFGAIFGFTIATVSSFRDRRNYMLNPKNLDTNRSSNVFSMVGTLFLWVFWPSFNGALANPGDDQERAVVNTYLSISASVVTAFATSFLVSHERKVEMEHVQNSTLAGGVAIGAIADQLTNPFGALIVGSVIGIISVCGFKYFRPWHENNLVILDSCGVMNLHGIPGFVSAIASIVIYLAYPKATSDSSSQPMAQLYAILTTLGIATGGGVITGWLLTIRSMRRLENLTWYEDSEYFENAVDSEGLTHVPNEPEAANRNQSIQMKTRSDNHKVITVY